KTRRQLVEALGHVRQVGETGGQRTGIHTERAAGLRRRRAPPLLALLLVLALRRFAASTLAAERHSHLAGHLRHHLAGFEDPVDELVALRAPPSGTVGDAQPARRVDDLRILAFLGRHATDDGLNAVELA